MVITIYTDGSFNKKWDLIGWAFCEIDTDKDECVYEDSGNIYDPELTKSRQVPGETTACLAALHHCLDIFERFGVPEEEREVHIYYDYKGVEMWATIEQKPWIQNLDFTKEYRQLAVKYQRDLAIYWHHVPSHTGNKWNEYVDKLARKACTVIDH